MKGFTVVEVMVVAVLVAAASGLFFYQKNQIEISGRDNVRKTAINTFYQNLEKVYYPQHKSYPQVISPETLSGVYPDTFTDTAGINPFKEVDTKDESTDEETAGLIKAFTEGAYEYKYEPTDCDKKGNCKHYKLKVTLEKEGEYAKDSKH